MEGLTPANQRQIRIQALINLIRQSKETFEFLEYEKAIFEIQLKYGLTEKVAREYIDMAIKGNGAKVSSQGIICWEA